MKTSAASLIAVSLLLGAPLARAEEDFPVKRVLTLQAAMNAATAAQDGKVIGAIGVSGNTPKEDEDIAKVGTAVFR